MASLSRKKVFYIAIGCFVLFGALFAYKAGRTITVIGNGSDEFWQETVSHFPDLPDREENRIDVLLVGIRGYDGSGEWGNGEWLADTIVLGSFNTENNQAAIVSIPRDLYVEVPEHGQEKINAVYAIGETRNFGGGGLQLLKAIVSQTTGVYVDHAVSVDFNGFKKAIDHLGGITIYRDTPFSESRQWLQDGKSGARYWRKKNFSATSTEGRLVIEGMSTSSRAATGSVVEGWEFFVPAGANDMNSQEALYYARSRYSSSDFDRMHRQQEVISAVRSKAFNLGLLANPVKIFNILDVVENNMRTDMALSEMKDLLSLAQKAKIQNFHRAVLDTSDGGFLTEARADNGQYILLPTSGDFGELRALVGSIVN